MGVRTTKTFAFLIVNTDVDVTESALKGCMHNRPASFVRLDVAKDITTGLVNKISMTVSLVWRLNVDGTSRVGILSFSKSGAHDAFETLLAPSREAPQAVHAHAVLGVLTKHTVCMLPLSWLHG